MTATTRATTLIIFSDQQRKLLQSAAEQAYPRECCGLLVGYGDGIVTISAVHPAANVADEPAHRFAIDPQVQFDLLRSLRGASERVVGHFHSHPNGARALSRHDLEMAQDSGAIWLLIPMIPGGRAGDPVAFICPTPDDPRAVEVRVI